MHVHGFAPVADPTSRVLILGSMPGKASLRAGRYYAHPRNLFWRFMASLLGFDAGSPYEERLRHLLQNHIALWDVLETCTRASSLDSDILDSSSVPNDFASFFSHHPEVSRVFFNGAKAEASFLELVRPGLPSGLSLHLRRLPSTSPANAAIPYDQKISEWGLALHAARVSGSS